MSDRTEEAKALREFMKEHACDLKSLLVVIVHGLKQGDTMFACLCDNRKALLELLSGYGAVEYACGLYKIRWEPKHDGDLNASVAYRIKPGYELPDLTEVTPPRYASKTWLSVRGGTSRAKIVQVVNREIVPDKYHEPHIGDWCAVREPDGEIRWAGADWDIIHELPPMPDKAKLAAQGYRLTMKAADCSKNEHGRLLWANAYYPAEVCSYATEDSGWRGWRWLVEKIEQESEEDTLPCEMDCMAKKLKKYCHEFGQFQISGSDIIPLRATIMSWSNRLKGAE